MREKYILSKGKYKSYVGMCIALTNYHILVNPLRDADGEFNKRYEQTSIDERFSKYTELKRNRKVQQQKEKTKNTANANQPERKCGDDWISRVH